MKSDYRRQLLLDEITGYNADLMCLQEVDTKLFNRYFARQFKRKGFEGVLLSKKGNIAEGVVTFYRADKFKLLSRHDIAISEALFENPLFTPIAGKINEKAKLKETMLARATPLQVRHFCIYFLVQNLLVTLVFKLYIGGSFLITFQVSVLRSLEQSSRVLVVANTHLWFRPQFPHVRLIQVGSNLYS